MKIYVCQNSPSFDVDANLKDMLTHITQAAQEDCDFVVFPARALASPVDFVLTGSSTHAWRKHDSQDFIDKNEKAIPVLQRHLMSLGKPMRVIFGSLHPIWIDPRRPSFFNVIHHLAPDCPTAKYPHAQSIKVPPCYTAAGGKCPASEQFTAVSRGLPSLVTVSIAFLDEMIENPRFEVPDASSGVIFLLHNGHHHHPTTRLHVEDLARRTRQHVVFCNSSYGGSMICPAPTGSRLFVRQSPYFGQEVMIADLYGMGTLHDILDVSKPIQYEADFEEKPPQVRFPWTNEVTIPFRDIEKYKQYMSVVQSIKERNLRKIVIPCMSMSGYLLACMAVHATYAADQVTVLLPPGAPNPLELPSLTVDPQNWVSQLKELPVEEEFSKQRDEALNTGFMCLMARSLAAGTGATVLWPTTRSESFLKSDTSGFFEPMAHMLYSDVEAISLWLNKIDDGSTEMTDLVPASMIGADPLPNNFGTWSQFDECIRLVVDAGYSLDQAIARKAGTLDAIKYLLNWRGTQRLCSH